MKITIESTSEIVIASGVECRLWEGVSEGGTKVQCLIVRIAADKDADLSQFEAELQEQRPPTIGQRAFPFRMTL